MTRIPAMRLARACAALAFVSAAPLLVSAFATPPAAPMRAMILDGESAGTYHKWQLVTPVLRKQLEETGLFDVDVVTAPPAGGDFSAFKQDFGKYKVVVSNYDAPDERWPADLKTSFENYVKEGGGFVTVHAADNAFPNWPAYNDMIGIGGWRNRTEKAGPLWYYKDGKKVSDNTAGRSGSHGLRTPFQIAVRETHPITNGLPKMWMHQGDELYATLRGPGRNMTVLATAYSDPANSGTGRDEPTLMALTYGKGRVFHTTLGHDVNALSSVDFVVTFQRGAEWAATGAVTQKVPASFPTATTVSYRADLAAMDPGYRRGLNPLDVPAGGGRVAPAPPQAPAAESFARQVDEIFARFTPDTPGCAVAVYQNSKIVFSKGYGSANLEYGVPITPATPFIIGSVSKQFTAAAIALLVEEKRIALSDDVRKYVPELADYGTPITIDHLVHHTSGLRDWWELVGVAGLRYDDTYTVQDVLDMTARQHGLNFTPGERYLYSNTGYIVLGLVVQRVTGKTLREFAADRIFGPLKMVDSHYQDDHTQPVRGRAYAYSPAAGGTYAINVWNNDLIGQGGVMTTVVDLAKWDENFYAGAVGGPGFLARQLERGRLNSGASITYAFGLEIGTYRGLDMVEHSGSTGGYRAVITRFPKQHSSIAALCNLSTAAPPTLAHRVADVLLRDAFTAPAAQTPAPPAANGTAVTGGGRRGGAAAAAVPLSAAAARQFEGNYYSDELDALYEISAADATLTLKRPRAQPETLTAREPAVLAGPVGTLRFTFGRDGRAESFVLDAGRVQNLKFVRRAVAAMPTAPKPAPPPARIADLVGEYESATGGHLYVLERDGRLWTILDRGEVLQMRENLSDLNVLRGAGGRVSGVGLASGAFTRLQVGPDGGGQLRITPLRPVADVLKESLAATPPKETGDFRAADLVEIVTLDRTIKLDVRYASTNNFLGSVFYAQARAFLQRPAADAVVRVQRALKPLGYGLLVHDGYRPWFVTKTFWDATPQETKWLVANPAQGSKHNRGAAVDLTLYDLRTGAVIEMPSTYDESTPRAYAFYPGGTSLQRWHRALLRRLMEAEGFTVNPSEWWHFDYADWRSYAIGNIPFEQIK